MNDSGETERSWTSTLLKTALGFFGVIAAFKLFPGTFKFFVRRYVLNLFTEIVVVVIAALLTEKAARKLTDTDEFEEWEDTHEQAP